MSEHSEPTPPTTSPTPPPPTEVASQGTAAKPEKRVRLIRWWGIIVLILPLIIVVLAAEFTVSSLVRKGLTSALSGEHLEMDAATTISASLLRGHVAIDDLSVRDLRSEHGHHPYVSKELRIAVNVPATLFGNDYIISRLASDGTRLSLRRRGDGTIAGIPEDIAPPSDPSEPWDLLSIAHTIQRWWERYEQWDWVLGRFPGSGEKPEPTPAPNWDNAVYYAPVPGPQQPSPRVLIETLLVRGDRISLPDALAAGDDGIGAFDISSFEIGGAMVSQRLEAGEVMLLNIDLGTHAAGALGLTLERSLDGGALVGGHQGLPLAVVAHREVSGDALRDYNPSGSVDLTFNAQWDADGVLNGTIALTIADLRLNPRPEARREIHQVSRLLQEAPVSPILWTLKLEGSLSRPRLSGLDLGGLTEAIRASSSGAMRELIEGRLRGELDTLRDQGSTRARDLLERSLGERGGQTPTTTEEAADQATEAGEGIRESADEATEEAKEAGQEASEGVRRNLREALRR